MYSVATASPRHGSEPFTRTRGAAHRAAPPPRTAVAKDSLLVVLAVIGAASVVWLAIAWAFQLSIIVFVTGSMAPTMPTGAAALVQHVSAAELVEGDVVTVPKPESGIPVTHRIVGISAVAGAPDERELTLRGDANDIDDPITYTVAEAERVIASAPALGWVVIWTKSPVAMVGITLAVALVIVWALWPSRRNDA